VDRRLAPPTPLSAFQASTLADDPSPQFKPCIYRCQIRQLSVTDRHTDNKRHCMSSASRKPCHMTTTILCVSGFCPGVHGSAGTRKVKPKPICISWQWDQLGHMQICTSPQTDNHARIPPCQDNNRNGTSKFVSAQLWLQQMKKKTELAFTKGTLRRLCTEMISVLLYFHSH